MALSTEHFMEQQKSVRIPGPLLCAPWLCANSPRCATTYIPQANIDKMSLGHLSIDLNLKQPELINLARSSKGVNEEASNTGWRHVLFSKTLQAVRQAVEQNRGYLDRKYVLQSPLAPALGLDSKKLYLKLPRCMSTHDADVSIYQFIALCNPWTGQAPDNWVPLGPESVKVWIDGKEAAILDPDNAVPLDEGPCFVVSRSPPSVRSKNEQPYVVEIEVVATGKQVTISHVLWR